MRIFWLLFITLGLQSTFSARETPMYVESYRYRAKPYWEMSAGLIGVEWLPKRHTILRQGETIIGIVKYPEVITQIQKSDGSTALMLLIFTERKSKGLDYSRLIIVTPRQGGGWEMRQALGRDDSAMHTRWISELGAINDEGKIALVKVGEQSAVAAPYTVDYHWETWDVTVPTLLKTGLTIDSGVR